MANVLTINGTNRSGCLMARTLTISDADGSGASTCKFGFDDRDGVGFPTLENEVIINNGERIFGGRIVNISPVFKGSFVMATLDCIDYTRDLDRNLVVEEYEGMTEAEIIKNIVDNYCGGSGITYDNVSGTTDITSITFNYMPPSECFTQIANLLGKEWWIDYNKDIHYQVRKTTRATINIII